MCGGLEADWYGYRSIPVDAGGIQSVTLHPLKRGQRGQSLSVRNFFDILEN